MLSPDKNKRRRELFLRQFNLTAQVAFTNSTSKRNCERDYTRMLIELAKPALQYPKEIPDRVVYKDLAYVWRMMRRRSKAWNGNIDLAPADLEDY